MHTRTTWLYALSLLLPTLLVAGILLRLLTHERERLVYAGSLAANEQARGVANQMIVTLEGVKADVMRRLMALPPDNLKTSLSVWERGDPLIRNAFIVSTTRGVLLPDETVGVTSEEREFLKRFESLFAGQTAWQVASVIEATPASSSSRQRSLMIQNVFQQSRSRQVSPPPAELETGWLPWFAGRNLYLLAWCRRPDGLRYGVELEMNSLLSGLITAFPERMPSGQTLVLLDGQNTVIHSVGTRELDPTASRLAGIPLAPTLPHWQIVVAGTGNTRYGRGLLLFLAAILCGLLVLSILGGGWLLLRETNRSLNDARTKTSFVANVSHELKTPLTTIRMYAELLSEGRARDELKRAHYLDVIVLESQRLTRLINNVLDFSRLEQGRKTYRRENLNLAEEARRIVNAQTERLQAAGLTVELNGLDAPCPALTDRDAFEQALLNILDNAAKYAAEGKRLVVQAAGDARQATIHVCDWGPGIPANHRDRLFQQFYRVDDTLTAHQPGCGLGLSISRRLLRDQGGDLRYEPTLDGGTCFVLALPRTTEALHEST